jgi:integrase
MKLSELANIYCDLHHLNAETRRTYMSTCSAMGNPTILDIDRRWLDQQKTCGIAPRTWNTRLGHLRALVKLAQALRYVTQDSPVVEALKKVRRQTPLMSAISALLPGEYRRAVACIEDCIYGPDWYWQVVIEFFYLTGVRRRQLCELTWSDINLTNQTMLLRHEGSKTLKQQTLPIHAELVGMLKEYRAALFAFGRRPQSEDQLFLLGNAWPDGVEAQARLTPYTVSQFFLWLSRKSSVKISAHRLRHTFATGITRHTDNIKQVQFLLTHSRVETTMAYIHPGYDDMLEVLDHVSQEAI